MFRIILIFIWLHQPVLILCVIEYTHSLFVFFKHCSNVMWKDGVHYHMELQILSI